MKALIYSSVIAVLVFVAMFFPREELITMHSDHWKLGFPAEAIHVNARGDGLIDSIMTRTAEYDPDLEGAFVNLFLAATVGLALRVAQLRLRRRKGSAIQPLN